MPARRHGGSALLLLLALAAWAGAAPVDTRTLLAPWQQHYDVRRDWPKGHGYKPFKRAEWELLKLSDSDGKVPRGALLRASARRKTMTLTRGLEPWVCLGPENQGGRATVVAFDPQHPAVMYAGAASGGLYKSLDGGDSWFSISDELANLCVGSFAIDPTDSEILYLGTGEAVYNPLWGIGLLKSTDGGASWQPTGLAYPYTDGESIQEISIDPREPQLLLVADYHHLHLSTDGGATFDPVLDGDVKDVVRHPAHPDTLLALLGYPWGAEQNGVYRSTDGGLSWARSWTRLPDEPSPDPLSPSWESEPLPGGWQMGRGVLAYAPGDGDIVYAGISGSFSHNGGAMIGIYGSTDGGVTWRVRTGEGVNHYGGQGWFALALAVQPDEPETVLSAGLCLYRSTNGAKDWNLGTIGWPTGNTGSPAYIHVDQHAITFHPTNPLEVWVASDGGLSKSTDGGVTWEEKNQGFVSFQYYGLGQGRQNPLLIFGGTQDNGTLRWTGLPYHQYLLGGDGGVSVVDYTNDSTVWCEMQYGGHYMSTDGGQTFRSFGYRTVRGEGTWVTPFAQDPFEPRTVYTTIEQRETPQGTRLGGVWVSHDQGRDTIDYDQGRYTASWVPLGNPLPGYMQTLAVSAAEPGLLYAGSAHKAYRYNAADSSWIDITGNGPDRWVAQLVPDRHDANLVYATYAGFYLGHVYRSTTRGTEWTDITGNLPDVPVEDLVIDPRDAQTLYAATAVGVFRTTNGGGEWTIFGEGLPAVRSIDLDFQEGTGLLRLATHGRGLWEIATGSADVELYSPNGRERLIAGGEYGLHWSGAGIGGEVALELNRDYPDGAWETVIAATPNDGAEVWIPAGPTAERARLRIRHLSLADQADTSNADFRIGVPWLEIVSPNGGEEALAGGADSVHVIADALPGDYVDVWVNYDYPAGEWEEAGGGYITARLTAVQWWPRMPASTRTRLRVVLASYPGFDSLADESDGDFLVRAPLLQMLTPVPGEEFVIGDVASITWQTEPGAGDVAIYVNRDYPEGVWQALAFRVPNSGQFIWTVTKPPAEHCRVLIRLVSQNSQEEEIMTQGWGDFRIVERAAAHAPLPTVFRLNAPAPNPFNPETHLMVELPATARIAARVYNRLGQEVALLTDADYGAGRHRLTFDGRAYASGLYFIRVEAAGETRVFKALLVK